MNIIDLPPELFDYVLSSIELRHILFINRTINKYESSFNKYVQIHINKEIKLYYSNYDSESMRLNIYHFLIRTMFADIYVYKNIKLINTYLVYTYYQNHIKNYNNVMNIVSNLTDKKLLSFYCKHNHVSCYNIANITAKGNLKILKILINKKRQIPLIPKQQKCVSLTCNSYGCHDYYHLISPIISNTQSISKQIKCILYLIKIGYLKDTNIFLQLILEKPEYATFINEMIPPHK